MTDVGPPRTDIDLLRAYTTAADDAAFTALMNRHEEGMTNAARVWFFRFGRPDLADLDGQVVQDAFLKLLKRAPQVIAGGFDELGGWLHAVVRTTAIDYTRRNKPRAGDPVSDPPAPAGPRDLPPDVYFALRDCLAALADTDRAVIELHYWGELSLAEVAAALSANYHTAARWHRNSLDQMLACVSGRLADPDVGGQS